MSAPSTVSKICKTAPRRCAESFPQVWLMTDGSGFVVPSVNPYRSVVRFTQDSQRHVSWQSPQVRQEQRENMDRDTAMTRFVKKYGENNVFFTGEKKSNK